MHELTPRTLAWCIVVIAFATAGTLLIPLMGHAGSTLLYVFLVSVSVIITLLIDNLLWAQSRLARSHELAAGLSTALDRASVARIVVERGMRAAAADSCTLHVLDPTAPALVLIGQAGVAAELLEQIRRVGPDSGNPGWGVVQSGKTLWVESHQQYRKLYPQLADLPSTRVRSFFCAPLVVEGRAFGILGMGYRGRHRFTAREREFVEAFTRHCAQALLRAERLEREREARHAAEQEQERANAANQAKDEFLATVSHELRTPLNAILGWAHMLSRDEIAPEKRGRAAAVIERNATAMAQLIEDLLDVSRIVSGKVRLEVSNIDLPPIIEAAMDAVRPAAEAKGILIMHTLGTHSTVLGDAVRLQQIAWNLLSNAVKFTPKAGAIEVALRVVEGAVELTVSDNGLGMDPRFLPYVFEPFRQADGSISRAHRGLGLGLAITKHLVELHGGEIHARSQGEGFGSAFTVRLPLSVARPGSRPPPAPARARVRLQPARALPPELQNLRILVVDDEEDARQLMREVLERSGALVDTAASASEALRVFSDGPPDVLLSDIGMPGENGYELIRRVRALTGEQGGNVPAAALTAYARPEDRRRALEAGYLMHVTKPVDPGELLDVVTNLVRSTRVLHH